MPSSRLTLPRSTRLLAALLPCLVALSHSPVRAEAFGCLITPSKLIELGSPSIGMVQKINVERGDAVKADQVLVTLRNDVEQANVDLASLRAAADAELNAAAKAYDLAQRKLERTQDLFKQNFLSAQAVDQAVADVQATEARRAQAREASNLAKKELLVARAQLDLRTLRSPINGIVVDVYRHPGERVEEKPILKIASVNPLNVDVVLPASMYRRLKVGQKAMVQPTLAGLSPVAGKVTLMDQVLDPASNTLRARIELPNPSNAIPAGLRCQLLLPDEKGRPAEPQLSSTRPSPAVSPGRG